MSYAGDVSPEQSFDLVKTENAIIVDVRTRAEWTFVGIPNLGANARRLVMQEWQTFPSMTVDGQFADHLKQQLAQLGAEAETKLCFLCRSGVRSLAAANVMSSAGFPQSYNITGGFEGDPDDESHRGSVNGWKAAGLPWGQN